MLRHFRKNESPFSNTPFGLSLSKPPHGKHGHFDKLSANGLCWPLRLPIVLSLSKDTLLPNESLCRVSGKPQ